LELVFKMSESFLSIRLWRTEFGSEVRHFLSPMGDAFL
jgi:hypothetical protein